MRAAEKRCKIVNYRSTGRRAQRGEHSEAGTDRGAQKAEPRKETAESREQRVERRKQSAERRQQRAESRELRAESREQRAESREQRAESREQRAGNRNRNRAESTEVGAGGSEAALIVASFTLQDEWRRLCADMGMRLGHEEEDWRVQA
jgi:hypothetical protein